MFEIKYDIKEDENGQFFIDLPKNFDNDPEHKYFIFEMCNYFLLNLREKYSDLNNNQEFYNVNKKFFKELDTTSKFIDELAEELSEIVRDQNTTVDELKNILKNNDELNNDE